MSQQSPFLLFRTADAPKTHDATAARGQLLHDAELSSHSGATSPAYAVAGTKWWDTSVSPALLKVYDGATWHVIAPNDIAWEEITGSSNSANSWFVGRQAKRLNSGSALTITMQTGHTAKQPCSFWQEGAGEVTFAGGGATIVSPGNKLKIADRYGWVAVIPHPVTANTFILEGNLKA